MLLDIVVKLRETPVRGDDEDATTATHGRRLMREGEGRMGIRVLGTVGRGRRSYRRGVTGEGRRMAATAMGSGEAGARWAGLVA